MKKVAVEKAIDSNDEIEAFILKRAMATGARLMSVGAYGRSRFSELILGGAIRHVFPNTTFSVLMSH